MLFFLQTILFPKGLPFNSFIFIFAHTN